MKKQFMRVLSIVLSLALFLGIVPTAALNVLAEAVGDVLSPDGSDGTAAMSENIVVTQDNMAWQLVFTGDGEDYLGMWNYELVNNMTDEEKAAMSWEIIPGAYDEDYNFVEVTSGHFEYLWFYGIGYESYIENIAPIGKTSGWWQPKVQKYWEEENPDDMGCIGLIETMDGWTTDPTIPMPKTFGELTGLSGDYYVPYTVMAYIRYVPEEGDAVTSYLQRIEMMEFYDGYDYIPASIHANPVNWKYSAPIKDNTVKAAIGQMYTPVAYQTYFIDRDNGYTLGAGARCGGAYGASCYCYMIGWMVLRDGVEIDDFTGDPSQFIPIGWDEAEWDAMLAQHGDDHKALYEELCWSHFTNNNQVPLYTTEGLANDVNDYYSNTFNLEDYSEYTIVGVVRLEYEEVVYVDGEEEWIVNQLYTVGTPVTIVPVLPGEDIPEGGESDAPVFKVASPLPEEIVFGVDPSQVVSNLVCDASYGEKLLTYQWYCSETPDYNGVAVNNGSGHEKTKEFYPAPPDAVDMDKTYYYYCEYSFVNPNGVTETYYTTITKVSRVGALAIDVTVTPGEIYQGDLPHNTNAFKSYYTRFNSSNLDLWNEDFTIPYAYQSKGSDSVLSAWIEPATGYGNFTYSDYITYQWYKSDTEDYTKGTPIGDMVTITGLEQFKNTRDRVSGVSSYADYNEANQYANIHIDCPTDEVGEFYMTVVLKNYYTDANGKQHVYETYSTCRVTTYEKNEDLYHVTNDGVLDAYNGHETVMTIPAEVNGIKVTSIDALACQFKSMSADADIHHVAGARKIVFPEGLTTISRYSFFRLYTLEEIVFSSTITTIEEMAFADTGRIKNLVIPATLTTIEPEAFWHSRIEKITFDENAWPNFKNAFYDSYYLNTVILPANATGDVAGAFYGCTQLWRVDNYENIENLDIRKDFYSCPAAEYLQVGTGGCDGNFVYMLNADGESWCITEIIGEHLEHVTIPDSWKGLPVTALGRGSSTDGVSNSLNPHLMKWPEDLKSVTIPDTITTINAYAFEGCVNLETFNFHENIMSVGRQAFIRCYRLSSDVVLRKNAKIYYQAFAYCYNIKKVVAKNLLLDQSTFDRCYSLESIPNWNPILPVDQADDMGYFASKYLYSNFWGTKLYSNYDETYWYYESLFSDPEPVPEKDITNHFRRSGNIIYQVKNNKAIHYYYADVNAMEITVPATIDGYVADTVNGSFFYWMLTEGYNVVFAEGITTLKETDSPNKAGSVTLPNSLTNANNFFAGSLLQEVHIPANLTNFSFKGCKELKKVTFAGGDQVINPPVDGEVNPDGAATGKRSGDATTGDGKTETDSPEVERPSGGVVVDGHKLTEIPMTAFWNCTSLTTVEFAKLTNLKTIKKQAFLNTNLPVIDLSGCVNLTTIEEEAFRGIPQIQAIYLPNNLTEIGKGAFQAEKWKGDSTYYVETLDPLSVLVLPEGLKTIGAYAFYGQFMDNTANAPFQLDLPDSLELIENDAFGGYMTYGKHGEVLQNNLVLANEKLPASLKKLGSGNGAYSPFSYSLIDTLVFPAGIEEIAYTATSPMDYLTKIVFEADETGSSNLRVLKSLIPNSIDGEIVGWDNLKKLEVIGSISFGDWKYDKEEYTIPSTVHTIGNLGSGDYGAFNTIIIPDGVQSIGGMTCYSTPENPRKIIAYGTEASAPKLSSHWLYYDQTFLEENGYELSPLYCYTGSAYHEWAVEHNYPYVLMDDGADTITLKFYDKSMNKRQVANTYFKSIVWKDKDGNVVGDKDLLTNVVVGEEYSYEVTFYNDKSWDYYLPFTSGTVTAMEGGASVNLTISPLEKMTLTGTFAQHGEPGFTVQVQYRASAKDSWHNWSTLTMTDFGEDGSFSIQVPVKDIRLIMTVTGTTALTETEKVYIARSGRIENGVWDLGEVKMDYKGAESNIRVNTDLSKVPNLHLMTAGGTSYAVSASNSHLLIREAIHSGVKGGDTVTLYSAYDNGNVYRADYIEPFTFTVPYDDDGTVLNIEIKKVGGIAFAPANQTGYLHVFDANGTWLCYMSEGSTRYFQPGIYTVVGMQDAIRKFDSLAAFEALGWPEGNYHKETITVTYEKIANITASIPQKAFNSGNFTTSVWVDTTQYNPYTGLAPVYVQYANKENTPGTYTICVRATGSAEAQFGMVNDTYAFGANVLSSEVKKTESGTSGATEELFVTLDASQSTFCFYANPNGRALYLLVDEPEPEGMTPIERYSACGYVYLPSYSFYTSPLPDVTDQEQGTLTVYAPGNFKYKATVVVDDVEKEYECIGVTELPYALKTYEDGASLHTVQVIVRTLDGILLWHSDEHTIRHDHRFHEMSVARQLDMDFFVGDRKMSGAFYFTTGVMNAPKLVTVAGDLDGYLLTKDFKLHFALTMSNPGEIIGNSVTLRLFFREADPVYYDVKLSYNYATGTFDGVLTFPAYTYSIQDTIFSYDFIYSCDSKKEDLSPIYKMDKAEADLAERQELAQNKGKRYELYDLAELQKSLDGDESLTPADREWLMGYASCLNDGIQLLNNMAGSSGINVDFQSSLDQIQQMFADMQMDMEIISLADDPPTVKELLAEGYTYYEMNGMPYYVFASDVSVSAVYLDEDAPENSFMLMLFTDMSTFSSEGNDDSMWDDFFQKAISLVNTVLTMADEELTATRQQWQEFKAWAEKYAVYDYEGTHQDLLGQHAGTKEEKAAIMKSLEAMKEALGNGFDKSLAELHDGIKRFRMLLAAGDIRGAAQIARSIKGVVKVTSATAKVLPGVVGTTVGLAAVAVDAGMVIVDAYETYQWMLQQEKRIQDYYDDYMEKCHKEDCADFDAAKQLLKDMEWEETKFWLFASTYYVGRIATIVADVGATLAKDVSLVAGAAIGGATGLISTAYDTLFEKMKDRMEDEYTNIYRDMIRALPPRCLKECDNGGGGGGGNPDNDKPHDPDDLDTPSPKWPPEPWSIDPSGYVYEAVASNRIEGATAQIYYLDENGNESYWDAAATYGEVNPQITDKNGKYGWMVPIGQWKVKVTKDGYYDADSTNDPAADANGWLPVPPPQMNVNIGLVSKAAPVINSVQMDADKIQVIFSQYMDIAHLKSSGYLLRVFADGTQVPVELEFVDAEVSPTNENVYYGRILTITRTDGKQFGDDVTLTVNGDVRNYAGTAMGTDYNSGKLSVGQVADALSHSYPNRLVMAILEEVDLALQVTDAQGNPMAGVEVKMDASFGNFLTTTNTTAVSDANGRVVFAISGRTAGTEYLNFTTANGLRATVEVRVDMETEATQNKPTANLSDYSVVDCGTELIISTDVENAIIYYTTNNTCPCTDSEERQIYTGPVALTESAFYRIAVWTEEGGYSERLNLHLTVEHNYDENGNCDRCGSSEGDDPIVEDIITFDGYSVSEDVNGLAFRFTIDATGMTQKGTTAVYDNAKVMYNGQEYSLVGMGAIVSNDADAELIRESADGVRTTDIFAKYLWSMDEDSASYAVRVIDIPENGKDTTVYARAYFVIEVEGEQVVVYADDVAEQTYNGVLNG